MKKTILISLAVSAAVFLSTTTAFAATSDETTQKMANQQVSLVQAVPSKITGTVEKIMSSEMVVKTKEGVSYFVPLGQFSKLDAFEGLKITNGTEVSLESTLNTSILDLTTVVKKDLKIVPITNVSDSVEISVKDNNLNTIKLTEIKPMDPADDELFDVYMVPASSIASVAQATDDVAPAGDSTVIKIDPVKSSDSNSNFVLDLKDNKLLFIASEITANGKTVKLSK